jgi:uncharacterized RDD family membrane protein YckC
MPWLEMLLTLLVAIRVAQRTEQASIIDGLFIGILAGLLGLALPLVLSGRLGLHNLILFLVAVGLGWFGGVVAQKTTGGT